MTPLEWQFTQIAIWAVIGFGVICGGCWWGLRKLGPEEGDELK